MDGRNFYISITFGAFCCFMFLLFSFFNAGKTKAVRYFQRILITCMIWTGSGVLMRLQATPGVRFWSNIATLGVLMVPVCVYGLLFFMLELRRKVFLASLSVFSIIITIINYYTDIILAPPKIITNDAGGIAFSYQIQPGVVILLLVEFILLVYVTVVAHYRIEGDMQLSMKLFPLLIGCIFVLSGNTMGMLPGNVFPFNALSGLFLSGCILYIMYKEYLFSLSYRVRIGGIYTLATFFTFIPAGLVAVQIAEDIRKAQFPLVQELFLVCSALIVWGVIIFRVAYVWAERMTDKKKRKQFEIFQEFQKEVASLFKIDELYKAIIDTIEKLSIADEIYVIAESREKEDYAVLAQSEKSRMLSEEELHEVIAFLDEPDAEQKEEISILQCDDMIQGVIFIRSVAKRKLNYIERECFHQIGAYTSTCLKNISIYDEVYQISIHDELTGLYNRSYYKEFVDKYWKSDGTQSLICMDLDDFKLINSLYGEQCGDEILKWCSRTILRIVGKRGATFRLGPNQFLVFTRIVNRAELEGLAKELQEAVAMEDEDKPVIVQPLTFSIGISCYPGTAVRESQLYKQSQKALFFAKKNGKNRIEFYNTDYAKVNDQNEEKSYEKIAPIIYALTATIDAKDSYTFKHSCNVSADAVIVATELGLNENEIQTVKEAGLLHDIGKIGIPESILTKQGKLTDEEYSIMKSHVKNSIEMIHYLPNMDYVIPAVLTHHERYDGKGYPGGLSGDHIPLLGRILAVCDSFDAITSKRSYKEALPVAYAVAEIERNKGTQFDPIVADVFISLVEEGKIRR